MGVPEVQALLALPGLGGAGRRTSDFQGFLRLTQHEQRIPRGSSS